ncbi:MAG: divergent polysaccharide deacetylase family protein [Thermodesulfobacteriota bacterium]
MPLPPHIKTGSAARFGWIGAAGLFLGVLLGAAGCSSNRTVGYRTEVDTIPPDRGRPVYEVYSPDILMPSKEIPGKAIRKYEGIPRVAIIIDDVGYDRTIAENLLSLDAALTFSVLPHSPHRKVLISKIASQGRELMLHLPMEPIEYPKVDPGPDALITRMDPDRLLDRLEAHLNDMPEAAGVNNHMGSRMTARFPDMYRIFSVLKERRLFFIDSYTTPDSACLPSARLMRIPFARRDVFLDHSQDPADVRSQINRLIRLAEIYGEAVAIGHPHPVTYAVLKRELPRLLQRVEIVPASHLVHTVG